MRSLVTGGGGFAGSYLVRHLLRCGHRVFACGLGPPPSAASGATWIPVDLTRAVDFRRAFHRARPDRVFHLAAITFVPEGERDPRRVWNTNVHGTWNVLQAAREARRGPRVLVVSSAEVYGPIPDGRRARESDPVSPRTLYAASKAAAEALAMQHALGLGVRAAIVRPFNHTGPGQSAAFLCPGIAAQAAKAESAPASPRRTIALGNLDSFRDFSDVRDVVAAYERLVEVVPPGRVVNVCSGRARSVREVSNRFLRSTRVRIRLVSLARRRRPGETRWSAGDPARMRGYGVRLPTPFRRTVADLLAHARGGVA